MYAQPILDSRQVVEGHCGSLLQPQINGGGAYTATSLGQVQRMIMISDLRAQRTRDLPDQKKK